VEKVLFTRATGFLIVPIWLTAMGWLVAHDVWPRLAAQDPPALQINDWLRTSGEKSQHSILDRDGTRIGTIWTSYSIDEGVSTTRDDFVRIERFALPIAPMTITAKSVFTGKGLLDEFTVRLVNADAQLELHGERFHSDFSFTIDGLVALRRVESRFKVPLSEAGLLGDAFKPFGQLANLSVGQSWRMQVFNPVSAVMGVGERFMPMLVTVVDREKRMTAFGPRDCFVVESDYAKAWVDERGIVHEQQIELPIAGTLRMVREAAYDKKAYDRARKARIYGWSATE